MPVSNFGKGPVWTSRGTTSRSPVSVWKPSVTVSAFKSNMLRICLGHYATPNFLAPGKGGSTGVQVTPMCLELTDKESYSMTGDVEAIAGYAKVLFPPPMRFKQLWFKRRGKQSLFVWQVIPPSPAYVVLGMVATTTSDPPSLDSVRCVPRSWCAQEKFPPRMIWSDEGIGERRASFWLTNSLHTLQLSIGTAHPTGSALRLFSRKFMVADAPGVTPAK